MADLDLDGGWLRVRQQMGRDGRFKDLKTEAGRRVIPLPKHVVTLLRQHREQQAKERADAIEWHDQRTGHGRAFSRRPVWSIAAYITCDTRS